MKAIAIFNNKGGVGKTTLICNLASYVASLGNRVLLIDADPQCNATVNILPEEEFVKFYYDEDREGSTIHSILLPLWRGQGYAPNINFKSVSSYALDLLIGDPRLSLMEDLLSNDWSSATSGEPRGLRTTLVFSELLGRCQDYDYVFFDMGPSLGALNRSILLSCDFFLTPMSCDIFSLLAVENIGKTLMKWKNRYLQGLKSNEDPEALTGLNTEWKLKFAGYVTQQYTSKTVDGVKRAVKAYEKIIDRIPEIVEENLIRHINKESPDTDYCLGTIPNFHSVIPMSQTAHKPIFWLDHLDGVVGAHFSKVKEFEKIIKDISKRLIENVEVL